MEKFGSVLTAMVTPFDADLGVDYEQAARLAEHLADNGSDGVVVCGTTGESPTLTVQEKLSLFRAVVEAVGGRISVIAGTGGNDTRSSVELTGKAAKTGVDGVMLVTPYYNKPSQEGLYQHFKTIAEATELPIMLYNVPGRTSVNLLPQTVARLAEVRNIVALKEASGDLNQVSEIKRLVGDDFQILSGDDSLTLPILAVGGEGVVSVASHLVGKKIKEMVEHFQAGRVKEAARIHAILLPLFRTLFITTNPVPVKTAMNLVGLRVGGVRPPLWEMGLKELEALKAELKAAGLS